MGKSVRLLHVGIALLFARHTVAAPPVSLTASSVTPPEPRREFRGAWVASVANIDWPSKPGLSTDQQQAEMIAILDNAQQMHLNAIVLQVRPACDALYESKLEPWSEYLTGQMGQPPSPYYDPLAFAVEEAHKRGIELHAWFNPYRAHHDSAKSPISETHISAKHPDLVRSYGKMLWLDPAEKGVQDYSINVILDVVKRYDIDGVHIDDYFYPYKEKGADGRVLDFPDDTTWQRYQQSNGKLSRDDWRRENVNKFIERLYKAVKKEKNWVKVGISPFGIWRPGTPRQIKGFDAYQEIYADSRLWLNEGWLDYWTPQLYWKVDQAGQSYPILLQWWVSQNSHNRHIWPGNYTSRVDDGSKTQWSASEILKQIEATRGQDGATGNVHFSMKALMNSASDLGGLLSADVYSEPALVPASPWLRRESLGKPKIELQTNSDTGETQLTWIPTGRGKAWLWVVQIKQNGRWQTSILPSTQTSQPAQEIVSSSQPVQIAVTPVDRCGNLGPCNVVALNDRLSASQSGRQNEVASRRSQKDSSSRSGTLAPVQRPDSEPYAPLSGRRIKK